LVYVPAYSGKMVQLSVSTLPSSTSGFIGSRIRSLCSLVRHSNPDMNNERTTATVTTDTSSRLHLDRIVTLFQASGWCHSVLVVCEKPSSQPCQEQEENDHREGGWHKQIVVVRHFNSFWRLFHVTQPMVSTCYNRNGSFFKVIIIITTATVPGQYLQCYYLLQNQYARDHLCPLSESRSASVATNSQAKLQWPWWVHH